MLLCPICDKDVSTAADSNEVLYNKCGHSLHRQCMQESARNGIYTCPICRAPLENTETACSRGSSERVTADIATACGKSRTDFDKYYKMLRINMPPAIIRQRMTADGIPSVAIEALLTNGAVHSADDIGEAAQRQQAETDSTINLMKYEKMLQVGMSEGAVRMSMAAGGVSPVTIETFFDVKI